MFCRKHLTHSCQRRRLVLDPGRAAARAEHHRAPWVEHQTASLVNGPIHWAHHSAHARVLAKFMASWELGTCIAPSDYHLRAFEVLFLCIE